MLSVIKQLAREHTTMIIVTHEMNFARDISDRIIFMYDGIVIADDKPEIIFSHPNQRLQAFLGHL